jgi:hypothetical protein
MSSTHCHRCKRMMASALPICPHCGAPQDERSRAESARRDRRMWLAMGIGALLGMAGAWAAYGGAEAIPAGLIGGLLAGRLLVAVWYGW